MAYKERAVKIALDKISGEIIEAQEVFNKKKDGFQVRKQYHKNEIELYCCECEQKLNVSTSKLDTLHFKHQPKADYCILKEKLTPLEAEQLNNIYKSKESVRHKFLKTQIAERLTQVPGVHVSSIALDNRFITKEGEKRRPDVYCKYLDKELVFEIQLSNLSLKYILNRYEFYKRHNIYLIWILDDFNIYFQSQMERDIKYLTRYENFFKLDETDSSFKLYCTYKFPYLTSDNNLHQKWNWTSVKLEELKFDAQYYQAYYYDFGDNKKLRQKELDGILSEIREKERDEAEKRKSKEDTAIIENIKRTIRSLREKRANDFNYATHLLNRLDKAQYLLLNNDLDLLDKEHKKKPALNLWINTAKWHDTGFLEFILKSTYIELEMYRKDEFGRTVFESLYDNEEIQTKYPIVKALLFRGYKFQPEDFKLMKENKVFETDIHIFDFCTRLRNKNLIDSVFQHYKLLLIIESIKVNKIIFFNYNNGDWVSFANNAISHYSQYWDYIEAALRYYDLLKSLFLLDKNGSFQHKLNHHYNTWPEQNYSVDAVIKDLFKDLDVMPAKAY